MNTGLNAQMARSPIGPFIAALQQLNPLYGILPKEMLGRPRDFFIYGGALLGLAPGAQTSDTLQIQADSDFLLLAATREVRDHAAGHAIVASPFVLVQVQDSGSGRNLVGAAGSPDAAQGQPIDNWFGTGQLPAYWAYPKLLKASASLVSTFTNQDGGTTFDIRYSYLGFKLFPQA